MFWWIMIEIGALVSSLDLEAVHSPASKQGPPPRYYTRGGAQATHMAHAPVHKLAFRHPEARQAERRSAAMESTPVLNKHTNHTPVVQPVVQLVVWLVVLRLVVHLICWRRRRPRQHHRTPQPRGRPN